VVDEWPVDFAAFRDSMAVRSETEEQAREMIEELKKLGSQVEHLNKSLEKLLPIAGSTGLDLSIPALRNLKRVMAEGKDPEPIQPEGCDSAVIREILGTDQEMTVAIWKTLGYRYAPEGLKDIPGMTDELMTKIRAAFVLVPDPDGPETANADQPSQ
jgi:hypothetical protein